ncbi:hypothetical protein [Streptomyces sp. CC224B]|uniref:hypothetical protein n=1 Tax=Streptomyces sp. CC224B TaxID=3044571 RepID=UPI0024A7F88D|nr:hypothetical protein [Streptomyces sp. CC224B]
MSKQLPASIESIREAAQQARTDRAYEKSRQFTVFIYSDGETEIELAEFEGPMPVPVPGQTVSLWTNKVSVVVDRIETFYGLGEGGTQLASVQVFVKATEGA